MIQLPTLSLYIHFPWCVKKCPYCDFNSHQLKSNIPAPEYISALIQDFKTHITELQGRQFHSIFLGGGTPSLFPSKDMAKLFEFFDKNNLIQPQAEITIEANPATIEHGKFTDYKAMGINRISLGVQSFQNDKLKALGRIHNNQDVYQAITSLTNAGFTNFNIDLMHGLPNQSPQDAVFDLQSALELNPTHLSWYQLTIEPNTAFAVKPPNLPDEDTLGVIEEQGKALIQQYDFLQYEVSAFAKDACQAAHNLNYWRFGDYIGIGAGAHGKITDLTTGVIKRHWKRKHPSLYLAEKTFPYGQSIIDKTSLPYEFMLNILRLHEGFSTRQFESATGLKITEIKAPLKKALDKGLLVQQNECYIPSKLGRTFLNDLINLFLPD
ncbi:radical SAM family heme chaperone HemW [Facilibium subflavum]|uniref:radical SAM family heme chaperone HemW n=1 Tax=Facilibium subflavum TaxID=2219058 RepID=UPI000E64D277|nr:radical SAM family heme chaperone HemW [Facilibium subflavum]